jgi:hypothetical protein
LQLARSLCGAADRPRPKYSQPDYGGFVPGTTSLPGFSLQDALPEVVRFFFVLLVWFVLLHWLYFKALLRPCRASRMSSHPKGLASIKPLFVYLFRFSGL